MRIAIDGRHIQDHFPGIARYTYNLVANLADLVSDEITLYHNPRLANTRYGIEKLERPGKVRLQLLEVPTFSPAEQLQLPLRLRRDKVDVLHSPYYLKPYLQPSKSVVTIHDVISAIYPDYMLSRLSRMVIAITTRLALASASMIITLSANSKSDLVSRYGVSPEKIAVTYVGADSRFQPRESESLEHVRQRYGLPRRFILYVGINKPHKNLVRLIKAFALLPPALDIDLVIAGKEDHRYPQVRGAAKRSPHAKRIRLLGDVAEDDLPFLYNLADLFVFPSLYEGFGLPPLEAMASGVPVVSSNTSSLPEVIGDAGILVDPEDIRQLADAMMQALEDEKLRKKMREKGLQRARAFSWRETARQTLELYEKVARQ